MTGKPELRAQLRQRRRELPEAARRESAARVPRLVDGLPGWGRAQNIGLYLPADGEMDTAPLAAHCRDRDRTLFLPVINADNSLTFAHWRRDQALIENRFGIAEPPPQAERIGPAALDILFMPLVGWDRRGGRLGMGGGFYDRTLAGVSRPLLVGLAHAVQEVGSLPMESWDVPLDAVITGAELVTIFNK